MKVLLLGPGGQLGWELGRTCPQGITLHSYGYPDVDLANEESLRDCINAVQPDRIVNAAAYTAVDKAEAEPELAWQINSRAVAVLAGLCREHHIRLAQISTDFVFSGENSRPYLPEDPPQPLGVYGQSKRGGEKAILEILGKDGLIIRTAWLYSSHRNNFVKTMLRLMAEKEHISVVDDQVGTPTWARGLAKAVWAALEKDLRGIFHWTDAGVASWYDFAMAVQEEGLALGLLAEEIPVTPVGTKEYPTPARRPGYSVLDTRSLVEQTGLLPVHWRKQLRLMLQELAV
ncbi:dTDP-4-dehydrorhamnose reductase [Desulfobacter vibrioformis]|uniref:dTDP-4-dehydrorhamnose reductase n=1 Tax=Desulfobacter vibrioformis TaxID=34031 RepID=UPI00054CE73F|nr:dTDP-4-dehydrorhamnose reductase [Desulfobacter vibrioformis]